MLMTNFFRSRRSRSRVSALALPALALVVSLSGGSPAFAQTTDGRVSAQTGPAVVQAQPQIYQTPEILGLSQQDVTTKLNQSFVRQSGFQVATPVKLEARDRRARAIECVSYCHPYKLRRPVVSVRWAEGVNARALRSVRSQEVPLAVDARNLRMDVSDSRGGFQLQRYNTVALRTVPEVATREGMGPDLRQVNPDAKVIPLLEVRDGVIQTPQLIPELNTNVPTFERLLPEAPELQDRGRGGQQLQLRQQMQQRQTLQLPPAQQAELQVRQERLAMQSQVLPNLKVDRPMFEELKTPYQTTMVVAQSVNRLSEVAERQLIVEGLEPGIAYRLRLVEELTDGSVEIAQGVCPVPACPADFVDWSAP